MTRRPFPSPLRLTRQGCDRHGEKDGCRAPPPPRSRQLPSVKALAEPDYLGAPVWVSVYGHPPRGGTAPGLPCPCGSTHHGGGWLRIPPAAAASAGRRERAEISCWRAQASPSPPCLPSAPLPPSAPQLGRRPWCAERRTTSPHGGGARGGGVPAPLGSRLLPLRPFPGGELPAASLPAAPSRSFFPEVARSPNAAIDPPAIPKGLPRPSEERRRRLPGYREGTGAPGGSRGGGGRLGAGTPPSTTELHGVPGFTNTPAIAP